MDSILTSVKKLLGISEEYTAFDPDITMCINSVFTILTQLGVGPSTGFSITDSTAVWSDFIPEGEMMEAVKNYIALKVRIMFDPPTSSTVMQATTNMISELEWRLNVLCDKTTGSGTGGGSSGEKISYNDLEDIPTLNDVLLKGDVKMDIASKQYVDETIGVVSNGEY